MARKKKSRAKPKTTIPLGLVIPGGLGTYDLLKQMWESRADRKLAMDWAILKMGGYNVTAKQWEPERATFTIGWGLGMGIHELLGKRAGVNKALGAAHVPYARV